MILSAVIPCYNVAKHIDSFVRNLPEEISNIIVVNDCSVDDTESILLRLQGETNKIVYVRHDVNQGVGGAMLTGFKKSIELNSDITIKMDVGNQMDSSYIHELIKPTREN